MMYTAFSTASLYPMEPEKAAVIAADCGYTQLELFLNCDYEFSDEYADLFLHLAEDKGITVSSVHPYSSLTEPSTLFGTYARRRLESINRYQGMIRSAARLGARYFILHGAGYRPTEFRELYPHEIEVYHALVNFGKSVGVEVLQENVKFFLSAFPAFFSYLKEAVPGIGFNLDFKQAIRIGRPLEEFVAAMAGNLKNVHINDMDRSDHCRLPGDGCLDYQTLFSLLDAVDYNGALVTEVYRNDFGDIDRIPLSKQFLENELSKFRLRKD